MASSGPSTSPAAAGSARAMWPRTTSPSTSTSMRQGMCVAVRGAVTSVAKGWAVTSSRASATSATSNWGLIRTGPVYPGRRGSAGAEPARSAEAERAGGPTPVGQPARDLNGGHRARHEISLAGVAAEIAQSVEVLLALDALGDDVKVERVRGLDDEADEVAPGRVEHGGERAIDLQPVGGQVRELADRRVPGAEVVDGHPDAELAQAVELDVGGVSAPQRRLGELDL